MVQGQHFKDLSILMMTLNDNKPKEKIERKNTTMKDGIKGKQLRLYKTEVSIYQAIESTIMRHDFRKVLCGSQHNPNPSMQTTLNHN